MSISPAQLAPLRSFGYTEVESRFLYLVATHSGYFTVRQFLDFAHAKSGKRNAHLIEKLFSQGHATAQRYRRRSCVYHLHSRALYDAIGKGEASQSPQPRDSTHPGTSFGLSTTSWRIQMTTISRLPRPNGGTS